MLNGHIEKLKYDTRLVDWNLKHGNLTESDIESYYNGLEDLSRMAEAVDLEDESSNRDAYQD